MQNVQLEFSNKFVLNSLVKVKKLIGVFSDSESSSNGGITLINEIDKLLGLTQTGSKYLTDDRCTVRSKNSFYQFLKSRVMAISCGHEDVNDLNRLRHDSALKESIGIDPACEYGLPSQPTTSKFESLFSDKQVQKFSLCLPEVYTAHSYRKPPKKFILDLDETFMPYYGNQQGSVFTGYEQAYGYKPLFVNDIKLGCVVAIIERPATTISRKEINTLFRPILKKIREALPDVEIVLRGDSHRGKDDFLTMCEKTEGVTYITGLPEYKCLGQNEDVQKTVRRCIGQFERKEAKYKVGKPKLEIRDYCEFSYNSD